MNVGNRDEGLEALVMIDGRCSRRASGPKELRLLSPSEITLAVADLTTFTPQRHLYK